MVFDPTWYHDMAATHHLTNDLSYLNLWVDEYTGNGQGLRISHIALASIPSINHNFSLQSLLHVPQIHKKKINFCSINLLVITKFLLNFTLPIFVLRISNRRNCYSKSRVRMASTCGLLMCLKVILLFLSLVNVSLWTNGTLN